MRFEHPALLFRRRWRARRIGPLSIRACRKTARRILMLPLPMPMTFSKVGQVERLRWSREPSGSRILPIRRMTLSQTHRRKYHSGTALRCFRIHSRAPSVSNPPDMRDHSAHSAINSRPGIPPTVPNSQRRPTSRS